MEGEVSDIDQPAAPVAEGERIVTLDFIRGIALLGILFANITAYAEPYTAYGWPPALAGGMTPGDQAVWLVQFVFVDGKFRGLFTLLFGAGMYVFYERSLARGEGRGRLLRRLLLLLLFGLAHYFLLWRGDILALYAVWGIVAVALVGRSAEKQMAMGLTLSLFGALFLAWLLGNMWLHPPANMSDARQLRDAAAELSLYRHGSYVDIVAATFAHEVGPLVQEVVVVGIAETIGLIVLGMAFYRYGLFTGEIDARNLRRWGWTGLALGGLAAFALGLWPLARGFPRVLTQFAADGLGALPHFVTTMGLIALLAAWAPRGAQSWLGRRLAATGRMAFSNYLGMSAVMMLVFDGWALGLFGRFHRLELLPFVAAGWALMLAWSPWWLARFRYGPLEWLWRCLTYGKRFRFRR